MAQVTVKINGRNYRMACDDGQEEHLLGLASRFDGYIAQLRSVFGEIGDQRLTVMAGVMVTDELVEMSRKIKSMEVERDAMREHRVSTVSRQQDIETRLASRLEALSKRIEMLADSLDIADVKREIDALTVEVQRQA
ncbi:MAG: cell division protein ZapA [Cohaesibacteraceae bacterium]|nr:cell division protein ZapA [Cohaesibacteraceae bacterium]MBL4876997.1 cell division protein ZapA [Cohaesibacteraceae bacterium]